MKQRYALIACGLALGFSGCSHSSDEAQSPSAAAVQAQVDKVQNDPNVPPQVRSRIVGNLQNPKDTAHPVGSDRR
jgi:hypothetical protein